MFGFGKPTALPTPDQALPGREQQMWTLGEHLVLHTPVVSDDGSSMLNPSHAGTCHSSAIPEPPML